MFEATALTAAAPGGDNDDYYLVGPDWAVVLDGISAYPGADTGCVHSVRWYVAHLAANFASAIGRTPEAELPSLLEQAISATVGDHGTNCDPSHPHTPGATVAVMRVLGDQVRWLVLGDATAAWQLRDGTADAATDNRADHLTATPVVVGGVRRYDRDYVASVRNRPGGFWVASSEPAAAYEALTGVLPLATVGKVGLFSDGATRLVERYGRTWVDLIDAVAVAGRSPLVADVRAAEMNDVDPSRWRGKPHDDVTAVVLAFMDQNPH